MALFDSREQVVVPRRGHIRRCRVRHVAIVPDGRTSRTQVTCLLGGLDHSYPLGTMDEARSICNACTARTIWRQDED